MKKGIVNLLIVLFYLLSCTPKSDKKEIDQKVISPKKEENCDSVWRYGVSFIFPNTSKIDSIKCIKNNSNIIRTNLRENDGNFEIVIYDTFLYDNSYRLELHSLTEQKKLYIEKLLFKPQKTYNGSFCSIKSCELNGKFIKADAGSFILSTDWDKK